MLSLDFLNSLHNSSYVYPLCLSAEPGINVSIYTSYFFQHKLSFIVDCVLVPGGWTEFPDYPECPVSCGGHLQVRTRHCVNPIPLHGGRECEGNATEKRRCNAWECQGEFS